MISAFNPFIRKAEAPAAFSAENAENASHTDALRTLWRGEDLCEMKGFQILKGSGIERNQTGSVQNEQIKEGTKR